MPSARKMISAAFLSVAIAVSLSCSARAMTAEKAIDEIFDRFVKWNIKTMSYDEIRVSSYESDIPGKKGTMTMDTGNATTMKMRYFYKAPDKHGYKLLSDPVENYWIGSPNQPGALPMDHNWKKKLTSWYKISISPKEQTFNGRKCYVVTLMPKPGMPAAYPMTWFVDKEKFIILKFQYLVDYGGKKVSTTGIVKYEKMNNFWLPVSAQWKSKVAGLPYNFVTDSTFTNYTFNTQLDASAFKESVPDNWLDQKGDIPVIEKR